jgi:glucokinase
VGGTNARFALVRNGNIELDSIHNSVNREYPSITDAIKAFLAKHGNPKVLRAGLALACPITGDTVKLTNCDWQISQKEIQAAFGLTQVTLVNDFTALAMGVPSLAPNQYFAVGGGTPQPHHPIGVVGPGTGFGVSGLIWSGAHWIALQGEGGHASFTPTNEIEIEILRLGWKEYGGRISTERILTGDGLEFMCRALCQIKGKPPEKLKASDITKEAMENPASICREVMNIFCGALGSAAGDLALTLGAFGGVYIGGGITARLGNIVHESPLRERFEAKGRFKNYMARIPTYVITNSVHTALLGTATILNNRR